MAAFLMPMSNARDAPRFSSDPSGFDAFFDNVNELARHAGLSKADKIKWACHYAGAESDSWRSVPCLVAGRDPAPTFAEFKWEVMQHYPHLSNDHCYTNRDLERLVDHTRESINMSRDDLGGYYRKFITYSEYLIHHGHLSACECNSAYLRGFPQPVRAHVLQCLLIKHPNVLPDEGYEFVDVHDAVVFVLSSGGRALPEDSPLPPTRHAGSLEQGLVGELVCAMSELARVFAANMPSLQAPPSHPPPRFPPHPPTPGGVVSNPPRWGPVNPDSYESGSQYLQQGKVICNGYGKLSLPDSRYILRNIPGKNIREENTRDVVATHFLEGPDECVFAFDIAPTGEYGSSSTSSRDEDSDVLEQIQVMQAQIDSLRKVHEVHAVQKGKRAQFNGVELLKRTGPPRRNPPTPALAPSQPPMIHARVPPPQPSVNQNQPPQPPTNVTGKLGARAGERPFQHPQGPMRPVVMQLKPPAEDPKFHYQSPVETGVKTTDLADCALDTKFMILTHKLLAAAPNVRRHVKDLISSKKVAVNSLEVDPVDSYLTSCFDLEVPPSPLDLYKYESSSSSAVPSLPLCVIYPSSAPGVEPECILDRGAQVVVMRKDVWERLCALITANKSIPMESANSGTTMTLGLVENYPVHLGTVTIYLQIQVVEDAPFEVLLGRPFFDVTSCLEVSSSGGSHEICIRDPKTGTPYMFATHP
ncbi:hypothetical protein BDM02DRAFT_3192654 [Thelephora ganbajun]|uniref:Uncharacterized protein n=1 Tax=Thelephora ganbajun TaxID=370292 RepID=A0ACB6YZK0_THEGA|nr:hypothetical protein BDM02DRAFT_3192654 [Thelephora ganbajun]